MPDQQPYIVKRPDGKEQTFPPGTPLQVMQAWYDGAQIDSKNAPPGLPGLGMGFPDNSKNLQIRIQPSGDLIPEDVPRKDIDLGSVGRGVQALSGFTKATPGGALLGAIGGGFGGLLEGIGEGEGGIDILKRALTEAGISAGLSVGDRGLSRAGVAGGLKLGGAKHGAWKSSDDYVREGVGIGDPLGRTKRKLGRANKEVGAAIDASTTPVTIGDMTGAPEELLKRNGGQFPKTRERIINDDERKFLIEQLQQAGGNPATVRAQRTTTLKSAAAKTPTTMRNVASVKRDAQNSGLTALEQQKAAREGRVAPPQPGDDIRGQVHNERAAKARAAMHKDPRIKKADEKDARLQRINSTNNELGGGYARRVGSSLVGSTVAGPIAYGASGDPLKALVAALLGGAVFTPEGLSRVGYAAGTAGRAGAAGARLREPKKKD